MENNKEKVHGLDQFDDLLDYFNQHGQHSFEIGAIANYCRSYPDAIQQTTEGQATLRIKEVGNEYALDIKLSERVGYQTRTMHVERLETGKLDDLYQFMKGKKPKDLKKLIEKAFNKAGFIGPNATRRPFLDELRETLKEGVRRTNCPECGTEVRTEPDATSTYCEICEDSVSLTPLM